MLIIVTPFVVAVVGLLMYVLGEKHPRAAEIGRIMFAVGLFWALARLGNVGALRLS